MASGGNTVRFPLHEAILRKNSEKVDELLQSVSVDVNEQDWYGNTPLHYAAITGNLKLAKELITRQDDIDTVNKRGETALHLAAQHGEEMVTTELMFNEANKDATDNENLTPLLTAAKYGCSLVVDTLLQEDAQVDVKDKNEKTVIYLATENDCVDVLKILLKFEEDNHYKDVKQLLNIENAEGKTPLLVAAQRGHVNCLNELLKNDADIGHTCGEDHVPRQGEAKKTALHFAAEGGWTEVVKKLLKSRKLLVDMKDSTGKTALHIAVIHGMKRTVDILLQNGADADALDAKNRTPLSYAAEKGKLKCARLLLNKDAKLDMDETSKRQLTPVQFAAQSGNSEIIELLLEVNSTEKILAKTDFKNRNCLDIAIEFDHKDAVLTIIQSDQWEDVLRNQTNLYQSPMRKLIKYMPDAAIEVFNRCTDTSERSGEFQVVFNYEFLDDTLFLTSWKKDTNTPTAVTEKPYTTNSEIIRDNHPLMIMVTSKRKELLDHPLVTALLKKKWHSVGLIFHLINFVIYLIYLIMLTGFTLDIKAPFQFANISTDDDACSEQNLAANKMPSFAAAAKYFVIILAVLELLKEIFELALMFSWRYFIQKENILEWITYISAILFVANSNDCEDTGYRPEWQWTCGTISVFLAWVNLLLFIQKLEWLGIYVVMFYRILIVFLKFFFVFSILIVAFSVSFHCLFQNQDQFSTFWTSLVKTTAMMIGELDHGSILYDEVVHFEVISYMFFYIFMLFMAIVIINLLIGLAVSNIQEFQDKAGLNKKQMQIKFALEFERRFFTTHILKRYIPENWKQSAVASIKNTRETLRPKDLNWVQKKIGESWGLTEEHIKRPLSSDTDATGRELIRLNSKVALLETNMKTTKTTLDSKLTQITMTLQRLEAMVEAGN